MDIKVLRATNQTFEPTTPRFSEAMRIGAVKWKPNFQTSSEAKRHYEDSKAR